MKKLNNEQRKFLEYLRDEHTGIGWLGSINMILKQNSYPENLDDRMPNSSSSFTMRFLLRDWKNMTEDNDLSDVGYYGAPIKYLK